MHKTSVRRKNMSRRKTKHMSRRKTKHMSRRKTKHMSRRKTMTRRKNTKKKSSAKRVKKFTGRKLLPKRAIIFPEPIIMTGGGIDKEMIGKF